MSNAPLLPVGQISYLFSFLLSFSFSSFQPLLLYFAPLFYLPRPTFTLNIMAASGRGPAA